MHSHEMNVRWSDLDPNRHLNNVMYVAYAEEARAAMAGAGEIAADQTFSAVSVAYRQPIVLTRRPVLVESTLTEDGLVQDIGIDTDRGRTSFAQVTSTLGTSVTRAATAAGGGVMCLLRRADLDATGHATWTGLFDLVQEGRTRYAAEHRELFPSDVLVVGRMTVTLGAPLPWRPAPYEVRSWIAKVTSSLVMIETEIVDGDTVHAHAASVHMAFDIGTQRSRRLTAEERAALSTLVAADRDGATL